MTDNQMTDDEMTDDEMTEVLRELTARVAALEDRAAIVALMTTYGPAIDAGDADAVAQVWTEDGEYDVDTGVMRGHDEIRAMVRGPMHQGFVRGGCAHILEPGHVVVDGDTAVATGKSLLVTADGPGGPFTVVRATANRWELVRVDGRWRCRRRVARLLDGRPEARALLAGKIAVEVAGGVAGEVAGEAAGEAAGGVVGSSH